MYPTDSFEVSGIPGHIMSVNQHGFRKGKSTESALPNSCEYIEDAITHNNYALGIFLDVRAAFDRITVTHIIQGLKDKNVD